MATDASATRNTFLAALPARVREQFLTAGQVVPAVPGEVLHESGRPVRHIWFPLDCVCALATAMENGSESQIAVVGREGVVGLTGFFGGTETTWNEASVQTGGSMLRVPVESVKEEASRSAAVRLLLQRFTQALLVQTSQTAACNRFHSIEQRLGRFLLALDDRTTSDQIVITHERLAATLGSLRPGVTLAAGRLQEQGIIRYTRGKIRLVDRKRLEESACECYAAVAAEYERLIGAAALQELDAAGEQSDDTLRDVNSRLLLAALHEHEAREEAEEARKRADVTHHLSEIFLQSLSQTLTRPSIDARGWAELLESGSLDDATLMVAAETIRRNVEAQTQLRRDMLELAGARAGRLKLNLQPVDVRDVVRAAVAACRTAADQAGVAVSAITGEPVTSSADAERLRQLVDRVLMSAIKSVGAGSAIELSVTLGEETVQISVTESGTGIEPLLLPYVQQQPAEPTTHAVEMGVGLAIARQLATLHYGTLQSSAAGDERAAFTITLPRLVAERHATRGVRATPDREADKRDVRA